MKYAGVSSFLFIPTIPTAATEQGHFLKLKTFKMYKFHWSME